MAFELFDRHGKPRAHSPDGETIYLWDGKPVAYLVEARVFDFHGHHLGWYANGWLRDKHGRCIAFSDNAEVGPMRPAKHVKPPRAATHPPPVRGERIAVPGRPMSVRAWSELSFDEFLAPRGVAPSVGGA